MVDFTSFLTHDVTLSRDVDQHEVRSINAPPQMVTRSVRETLSFCVQVGAQDYGRLMDGDVHADTHTMTVHGRDLAFRITSIRTMQGAPGDYITLDIDGVIVATPTPYSDVPLIPSTSNYSYEPTGIPNRTYRVGPRRAPTPPEPPIAHARGTQPRPRKLTL